MAQGSMMPQDAQQPAGDGAHTHPSYDSKMAELESRITALEGGGSASSADNTKTVQSNAVTPPGVY